MSIKVEESPLSGVLVINPEILSDDRGDFFEAFNDKKFLSIIGEGYSFVQDNQSFSRRGVLRGLHYQTESSVQAKLVRVLQGEIFDVVVDLRLSSSTYGEWFGVNLSAKNKKQLWIPPGFAHGYLVISPDAVVIYKTTNYWNPKKEVCIKWSDSELNINWPTLDIEILLSDKDRNGCNWAEAPKFII
jgi:dTDP-4-dehydrorhamnose 3,5-epimerase